MSETTRVLEPHDRLELVRGSISQLETVREATEGVTHALQLAACKEVPSQIIDLAVKQFILFGADAGIGHFHYPHPVPLTERQEHSACPGCYALSKVLEEVMLEQCYLQYDLNGCCLRAAWIMERDDFKYQLSFGEGVFGGPRWRDLVGAREGT